MDYAKAGPWFREIKRMPMLLLLLMAWCVNSQELICHPKRMDIVFVLDGSNSVRPWHFKSTKDAVKGMVDEFKSIGPDTVQIGLMQYGSLVKQEFDLNQYETKEEINEAIDNVEYMARGTMTGAALKYLVTYTFTDRHGARTGSDVEKVAVFITDGRAQDPRDVAMWHQRVKDSGIEVYVIGVGHHISNHDLQVLASEPKDKHVFHVRNFQSIQSIHVTLEDDICVAEINECLNGTHNCEQICTNTLGSFVCSCDEGFELEEDGFSCKPLPPTPPVQLQISDITHTSARVSWSLGNPNGTSKVEYYTVTYQPSDGSSPPKSIRVTETETELTGLMPGTNYNVSVTSHGNGLQSDPLKGNDTTLFLGKTTVTVSNPTLTTLHAEWVPAGGDMLTGYSVKVHEISAIPGQKSKPVKHASQNVKADVHNMTITGLEPGTMYKVIVTPKHDKLPGGKGTDSGTTLKLSPPDVAIPKTTFTTAQVQWTDIGVKADNYTVRLSPIDSVEGGDEKVLTTDGTVHSTVFHGLRPGTQYRAIVVGSVMEGGRTFVSEGNSTNTTLSLVAPKVEMKTTTTTANVTWSGVGADAKMFTIRLTRTDVPDGAELVATVAGNLKSTEFTGLVPGATYRAAVVGHVVDDGVELLSPEGTASGTTALLTAPNVTIPETTIGSATVKWGGVGPKADKFVVYLSPTNTSDPSEKLNVTVSGDVQTTIFRQLKPSTKYTATVVGYVKDAASPEGTAVGTTKPLPSPKVTVPKTSFTTVDVTWSWPVDGDVLDYVITSNRAEPAGSDELKRIDIEADVLNTTFTGLVPGQLYDVKLVGAVLDKGGIYTASATTSGRTLSLLPPNVTVSKTTFTTATVNWGGIGTDAKRFSVQLTPTDSDGKTRVINTTGDTHSTVFTGLDPGTKYTATVVGFVEDGDEELSSPEGTAQGTTPSLITPNVQIATTSTTANVSWDGVGADAKLFTVRLRRTDVPDGAELIASVAGDLKSTQFTGLVPGATYTASVVGHVIDNGTELLSPQGTASGTTSSLSSPNVTITETTIGSATVTWDGIGIKADKFIVRLAPVDGTNSKTLNVTVDGNTQTTLFVKLKPETKYVATVVGYVGDVASPEGTDMGSTLPLPNPVVSIPETSFTTLHTNWSWAVNGDIENFVVVLYRGSSSNPDEKLTTDTDGDVFKTTFTGLTPGQLYSAVVVGNVNDKGGLYGATGFARGKTLDLLAPEVTIPKTTFTTAQVNWTGIGPEADRFEVHLRRADAIDSDEEKIITTKGDVHSTTFTGLTPGATYIATVTGFITDNGTDLASPVGKAEGTTLNIQAPDVTFLDTTYTTAHLAWTGIGAEAIRFEISLEPVDGGERKVATSPGSMRTIIFTDLMPGTKYTANVTGFVNDGDKELESPVGSAEGTTLSLIAPVVTIPNTTFTTATVKWTDIGADAKAFKVVLTSDVDGSKQTLETSGDNRTATFTMLQPNTTYTATVVGVVDNAGSDFLSPAGSGKGTTKTPPTPTINVTNTGLSIMDVEWSIPGDLPQKFELEYFPTNSPNDTKMITTATNDLSLRLRNLTPSTEYTIKIKAVYIDGGTEVKSPEAATVGTTKSLAAPDVSVVDTRYRSGKISWTGVGMTVHHWIIKRKVLNGGGPGNLEEELQNITAPPGELLANLADLGDLNEAEVIGVVVEDGKEFESPVGSTVITLDPVPPPQVNVTNTSLTTLDASWQDDIVPDQFVIRISEGMPFKLENLQQYMDYAPGKDAKTVNGSILSNTFTNLTPGTEYVVSVWAKVIEGGQDILSLSGLSNGATRPLPPENLKLAQTPSKSLQISFDPPSKGQATAFDVKCVPKGTDPSSVAKIEVANDSPKSTKSTSCKDLKPGITYDVYARTMLQSEEEPPQTLQPKDYNMNKQSYGPYYSEYVKASETIDVGPVNHFTLSQPTTHSLLATWQLPDHVDQVDHYILTYKAADSDQNATKLTIPGNETSKLLSILHPDTPYEADIFPVVNAISGPTADDSEMTLKDNVSIQVVDTNFTSISVEWPISKVPGASYRIYWSPKGQTTLNGEPSPPNFVDVQPGQSTTTLNNLLPATMYDISIDYVYQTAPPGKAQTVGSTGLPPPGPINFTDVAETSFVAHWLKPQFDAEPIGYHVTYTGPDGIPVSVDVDGGDTLSLEIDDAQPGSLYDFTVAADYGDMGLSEDVAAKVTTDEPTCSCATYVRRQQQMEKTVGKLVDIIGNLQRKIDDLQNFLTIQGAKNCAIAPGRRDETTSDKLDANSP